MIPRYTSPEMERIWSLENMYAKWLEIEILACEAWARLGRIPPEALEEIKARAGFDVARIAEIEKVTRHDLIAFLRAVAEKVGEPAKYIHMGLTSNDVKDTAQAALMKEAGELILADIDDVLKALREAAKAHAGTVMIGRTHGVHAEPITFGLKLAGWHAEMRRNRERIRAAVEGISVGKISGAVGTYGNLDPRVEEYVLGEMGLKVDPVSTQILSRDRHAEYVAAMAVCGTSLERFTTEIRTLQRTEVLEVEEPFREGQKGSSAMPHKRNPIVSERIAGLARVIRGMAMTAFEDMVLWNERDISHSSAERVILPDVTSALDYMLRKFAELVRGMRVNEERMLRNLELTGGLIFSEAVMLALVEAGMTREAAYDVVQRVAMRAWRGDGKFKDLIAEEPAVRERLSPERLSECFDYRRHLRHVEFILKRAGIL